MARWYDRIPKGWTLARLAEATGRYYYDDQGRLMLFHEQRGWVEAHKHYAFLAFYRKRQMVSNAARIQALMRGAVL